MLAKKKMLKTVKNQIHSIWFSHPNTIPMKSLKMSQSFKNKQVQTANFRSCSQMERKRLCLPMELREKYGLMATRSFGLLIRISNRLLRRERRSISSLMLKQRKQHTQIVYRSLSFRMSKSRSTSLMVPKRSISQMVQSNVFSLMAKRSPSSPMEQSRKSTKQASELSNTLTDTE